MRWAYILLVLLAACGQTYGGVPGGDEHGYLLIGAETQGKGWAVVDAIQHGLPSADADRIRTAGAVRDETTMFIDFNGDCTRDQALVERMRKIAIAHGSRGVRCSPTPPPT